MCVCCCFAASSLIDARTRQQTAAKVTAAPIQRLILLLPATWRFNTLLWSLKTSSFWLAVAIAA
jgi:hypothetical protein